MTQESLAEKLNVDVITIANAFELVYETAVQYSALSALSKADEKHFAQKASFWITRYGFPKVVVCTSRPSKAILEQAYAGHAQPAFVEPQRRTSSVCVDLLQDPVALRALLSELDSSRKVFLAPYVHTRHFETLVAHLMSLGFEVIDYRCQANLVSRLWSKTEAQRIVFHSTRELRAHRPRNLIAESDIALTEGIIRFAKDGIREVVVKSATAVGGSGIFYVRTDDLARFMAPSEFLFASGQNEGRRLPPFIIEERVPWEVSPTVDVDIWSPHRVDLVGVGLQRLHDRRYYNGFYSSRSLESLWWFDTVKALSRTVASSLAQLGYVGPANVDFVVSLETERVTLIEVNPRRSALIDGYGIRLLKNGPDPEGSVSAADYVNLGRHFPTIEAGMSAWALGAPQGGELLPVSDGGFSSNYRWVGLLALAEYPCDSEDILDEAVSSLQDPARNEVGSASLHRRVFSRVSSGPT